MSSKKPASDRPKGSRLQLAALAFMALVAGLASGAFALYVTGTGSGAFALYVTGTGSGNAAAAAGADASCPFSAAVAKTVDDTARGEIAALQALDTPFDASDIAFKTRDNAETKLAAFKGKTLLVNLWATWCAPCRAEMPALDALEREKGGADFAVLPINVDIGSAEKPLAFYAEAGLSALPFLRDETMGVFTDLKARGVTIGLPVSLVVDDAGCARAVLAGPAEWASPDAFRLIDALKGPTL